MSRTLGGRLFQVAGPETAKLHEAHSGPGESAERRGHSEWQNTDKCDHADITDTEIHMSAR